MKNRDVRLNVITLDFANELGQDDESEEEEGSEMRASKQKNANSG